MGFAPQHKLGAARKQTLRSGTAVLGTTCQLFDNEILHKLSYLQQSSKLGVLRPGQQPGSYWDRSSALSLVRSNPHRRDSL